MCGIAGIFHSSRIMPVDGQLLLNMAAIQFHRGPDGIGFANPEGLGMGMSHVRLAINDLSKDRASQPYISQDGRYYLVHNGEIYDYQRIRARLCISGSSFFSKSDSEVILHLIAQLGLSEAIQHLRGEFAFALFDAEEDCLYLVRDRFGVKPLYWTRTKMGLVFGSEIKCLFAHPDVHRRLTPHGIYHQLIQVSVPGETAFDGVFQVEPGCIKKISRYDSRLVISRHKYWDIGFPASGENVSNRTDEYYIEGVREKVIDAVSLRLQADVPVVYYLSGGIDSGSLLGVGESLSQKIQTAFTIGFESPEYDESSIAREVAREIGTNQLVIKISGEDIYKHYTDTVWHTERTFYNTLSVAKFLLSKAVRSNGYKVVITGEGADELFSGYPAFKKDFYMYGSPGVERAQRRAWQKYLEESNSLFKGAMLPITPYRSAEMDRVLGFTPACLQAWLSCHFHAVELLNEDWQNEICGYDAGGAIVSKLDLLQVEGRHPLDISQYVWLKTMFETQILGWVSDRVDMAHSIETRPAFLDHHLAEFAAQIPPSIRIRGSTEKYVLRKAMDKILPDIICRKQKFAFMAPPVDTVSGAWNWVHEIIEEYVTPVKVESAGLLQYSAIDRLIKEYKAPSIARSKKVQLDAMLNHILGVQILNRQFIEADLPSLAQKKASLLGWHLDHMVKNCKG
ncbi:asparagine synthase (glutamine-hydrolyzing) [Microbulbifer sp. TRSA001]|uniref:asparagine synthase (glutamine-hydrolyzing) n=1 Tax=unclassified Microbulbifer TaxID=2619833 RepID=UPI0024ADC591|nr:asparagine synthase (glutamine-hydrolyzing) [Microbulbifer sp. VAAF005]WHI46874.1 asparagine synthase (glutamine-hydrolyzing) [Microbulbifer sp. VAAF005]